MLCTRDDFRHREGDGSRAPPSLLHRAMLTSLLLSLAMTAPTTTTAPPSPAATASTTKAAAFAPVDDKTYGPLIQQAHAGKVLVVNFWASYCLPCLTEIPDLQALAQKYKDRVDVVFVSTDDPATSVHVQSVLARRKLTVPSFIVSNADPRPFITRIDDKWQGEMPTTVIYGPDGSKQQLLIAAHTGAEFEAAIVAALAKAKR